MYVDKDFKGERVVYNADTPKFGKYNDKFTSLRVGPNTTAVLWSDSEFKGKNKVLFGDVPHVGSDFNDKVLICWCLALMPR